VVVLYKKHKKELKNRSCKIDGVVMGYTVGGIPSYCTLHLLKYQPEDGPTIGPKHVAGIIT
jgi:hypothetical protein